MASGKLDGIALGSIAAGTVFVYAGLKGKSVLASIQTVVQGNSPATSPNVNPIKGTGNPNATPLGSANITGSVNGTAIAQDAVKYQGHAYLYGGAPGPNGSSPWDCSSFCNWVLSHDMKIAIPGGSWNPATHGPATGSYLVWAGASRISRSNLSAGDLCVWPTHMGIALNGTQMISALNPSLGTAITTIDNGAPGGEPLSCLRIG